MNEKCNLCYRGFKKAVYDGETVMGSWAYMCEKCFARYGTGLGLGKGNKLKVENVNNK